MSGDKQTVEISETEVTLSSLTPETNYEISVAAVNTKGTGVSENISATTSAGSCTYIHLTNTIMYTFFSFLSKRELAAPQWW